MNQINEWNSFYYFELSWLLSYHEFKDEMTYLYCVCGCDLKKRNRRYKTYSEYAHRWLVYCYISVGKRSEAKKWSEEAGEDTHKRT